MALLFKSAPARGAVWQRVFKERAPEIPLRIWPDAGDPAAIRYLAAWLPPDGIMERFPNLELIFSTGAGADQFDLAALPPEIPLIRMLEPGIAEGMIEFVTLAALALHRHLPGYIENRSRQCWAETPLVPAARRRAGVLGLGWLGEAAARRLALLGFDTAGWSRGARAIDGVACYSGWAGLNAFLARTELLVCLLPLTAETRGILNAGTFAKLPRGAMLVNAGRGGHLIQADLLEALDSGQLSAAFLDVADPEPLPPGHPLWAHPKIMITPHVASMTQPETAAAFVLDNIQRHRRGLPLKGAVDRLKGY